jgi:hypothetical protein
VVGEELQGNEAGQGAERFGHLRHGEKIRRLLREVRGAVADNQ